MTVDKVAISLPPELIRHAKRAVSRGKSASLSAYVAEALDEKMKLDVLSDLLDEMLSESGGPLTAAEKRQADRDLGLSRPKKKRAA